MAFFNLEAGFMQPFDLIHSLNYELLVEDFFQNQQCMVTKEVGFGIDSLFKNCEKE